jgi:hypothetical protein
MATVQVTEKTFDSVEQVLADVPTTERCRRRETTAETPEWQLRDTQPTLRPK